MITVLCIFSNTLLYTHCFCVSKVTFCLEVFNTIQNTIYTVSFVVGRAIFKVPLSCLASCSVCFTEHLCLINVRTQYYY